MKKDPLNKIMRKMYEFFPAIFIKVLSSQSFDEKCLLIKCLLSTGRGGGVRGLLGKRG